MKTKLFALALVLVALSLAAPAYGSACTIGLAVPQNGCTLDNGLISFTFAASGNAHGSLSIIGLTNDSTAGTFGFQFAADPTFGGPFPYTYGAFFFATVDPSIHIQSAYGSATGTDGTLADYRYYMNSVIICTGLFSTQTCAMNAVQAFGVIEVGGDFSSLPNFPGAGTNTSISLLLSTAPLDSVPEPTTLLLSGSGFLALGVIAFVRQKRSRE